MKQRCFHSITVEGTSGHRKLNVAQGGTTATSGRTYVTLPNSRDLLRLDAVSVQTVVWNATDPATRPAIGGDPIIVGGHMRTQFYAIGLDDDQKPEFFGLIARQHGRKSDMAAYVGQYVGTNTRLFSDGDYDISKSSDEGFRTDLGVEITGAIYRVIEL